MRIFGWLTAAMLLTIGTGAAAQTLPTWKVGRITWIYADPSDVVLVMDSSGPCGGNMVNIRRSAANFQEMTALMYTVASTGKQVSLYITSCDGERSIASHGGAQFQ
jgi:hypothetical protein